MTTLPSNVGAGGITDNATTEGQQKTNFAGLRTFIADLFGTDSTVGTAVNALFGGTTEDTAPVIADDFVLTRDTSASAGKKVKIATMLTLAAPYYRLMRNGFSMSSNASDPNNDVDISGGSCTDSTGVVLLTLGTTIVKRLDAAWAVGTGNGGLDTGAKAISTWYYFWLIRKDSDGSIDVLFSASATAPTMPAGYTYKRRLLCAARTDASGNIRPFDTFHGVMLFRTAIADVNVSNLGLTPTTYTLTVPTLVGIFARFSGTISHASTAVSVPISTPGFAVTCQMAVPTGGGFDGCGQSEVRTVSGQITAVSSNTSTSLDISTHGFVDRVAD